MKGETINRSELLSSLKAKSPDVLIIGAGLDGTGVFRDLALNGVEVLIVDRDDFGSDPGPMVHPMAQGGIRILEEGNLRLAWEAARERDLLIENAAHLVKPVPVVMPISGLFSGLVKAPLKLLKLARGPVKHGALAVWLELFLSNLFNQGIVPAHKFESRESSARKHPGLADNIRYSATYYDGQILSPARLALECVLDGEAEGPHAKALNYASLAGGSGGKLTLRDELTGALIDLTPRLIISAGPWDDPLEASRGSTSQPAGGRGLQLVLDHPELCEAVGTYGFCIEGVDGGLLLVQPFYEKVMLSALALPARSTASEDVESLFEMVSSLFPGIRISPGQCVFQFSSAGPLENLRARGYRQKEGQFNDIPVHYLGGQGAGFRARGEQAADRALALLGKKRIASTKTLQTGGGKGFPQVGLARIEFIQKVANETRLGELRPKRLFDRYGTRALEIGRYMRVSGDEPLRSNPGWTRREVQFLVEREKAVHLDDILVRRTSLAWLGELSLPLVEEISVIMASSLGWSPDEQQAEIRRVLDILKDRYGVILA